MATDFSILAWRIPWTKETGGLQSIWSQKSQIVLNDSATTGHFLVTALNSDILIEKKKKNAAFFLSTSDPSPFLYK